ncbi:MAG: S1C family serine protease [Christensenellales bacterium]|jgi:S1-C subfamily serine protease
MDLFNFDDMPPSGIDTTILIDNAIRKYRKSTISLMVIFGIIVIALNLILIPYFMNERINGMIEELDLSYERQRSLPDNYTMIGVEVGLATIDSVIEINCRSFFSSSSGTGLIISDDGYVLTNAHVITYGNGTYPAIEGNFYKDNNAFALDVISYDNMLDLALLKFNNPPDDLKSVVFGNSDNLNLGEEIVAIGNAQGMGLALTVGVVSDPLKTLPTRAIQIDAAINPGNSGGPLFNIYSEFVGITTFKIVDSEANEGLGFAIPSADIIEFIEKVERIERININYKLSEQYNL